MGNFQFKSLCKILLLFLAHPVLVLSTIAPRLPWPNPILNFKTSVLVAVKAAGVIGAVCVLLPQNCITAGVLVILVLIISGFTANERGSNATLLPIRAVGNWVGAQAITHHYPNGSFVNGYHPRTLELDVFHTIRVDNKHEVQAKRVETGHIYLEYQLGSSDVDVGPIAGSNPVSRALRWGGARLARRHLSRKRAQDDDPGQTNAIAVFYNDIDAGHWTAWPRNSANEQAAASQIGNAIVFMDAETVCAEFTDGGTVITETEWVIRGADGSWGQGLPSGGCNKAIP